MKTVEDVGPLGDVRAAFETFAVFEGIAKSHQKERAALLKQADFERDMESDGAARELSKLTLALATRPIEGAVPAILRLSYDQLVMAIPGDLIYALQLEQGKWVEHLFGPADTPESIKEGEVWAGHRRECECGQLLFWDPVNVAIADPEGAPSVRG